MADAIFGSPARRPFQDKKTALTKNEILKITLERKEGVNGMHFLQLGFGKMAALPRVDKLVYFRGGCSRGKCCGSRHLAKPYSVACNGGTSQRLKP